MSGDGPGFHDNAIHGIRFVTPEPEKELWISELILDIDHILEWIGSEDGVQFKVAPATLTFSDVQDLRLAIDIGGWLPGATIIEPTIDQVLETAIPNDERGLKQWQITLSVPPKGEIAFVGSGYRLDVLAEPVLLGGRQSLTPTERAALLLGSDHT